MISYSLSVYLILLTFSPVIRAPCAPASYPQLVNIGFCDATVITYLHISESNDLLAGGFTERDTSLTGGATTTIPAVKEPWIAYFNIERTNEPVMSWGKHITLGTNAQVVGLYTFPSNPNLIMAHVQQRFCTTLSETTQPFEGFILAFDVINLSTSRAWKYDYLSDCNERDDYLNTLMLGDFYSNFDAFVVLPFSSTQQQIVNFHLLAWSSSVSSNCAALNKLKQYKNSGDHFRTKYK